MRVLGTSLLIIPELRVLVLTKEHVGSGNKIASLARAHDRLHIQIVRDFPQIKIDSEINASFLLKERGKPRFFSGICQLWNTISFEKIVPNWVCSGQGEEIKPTTQPPEKVQYSCNQAIKKVK